jgi:ubiquinol-cytochrome c reductase cytochrome c1 subunit
MRTPRTLDRRARRAALALLIAVSLASTAALAEGTAAAPGFGSDWQSWQADTSASDRDALQRGARDFFNYCSACHSLQYVRYSRIGEDLRIPPALLEQDLVPADAKPTDYVTSPMPPKDAVAWFGKQPPDLSLIASEYGPDYLYQYLTTFYIDPSRPTGANNLALPNSAMPDVLSQLEGLKRAVFRNVEVDGTKEQVFDHFVTVVPGSMSREQYDSFARDIVDFLAYVSDPVQVERHNIGVWVVLFLLAFTWLAWLLKKEYWKDIH